MKPFASFVLAALVATALAVTPARAADQPGLPSGLNATVAAFISAINAGDAKAVAAAGAPASQAVIDDFGPHYWNGPNALYNWFVGFTNDNKAKGLTDATAAVSEPTAFQIDGNRAWVTYPMTFNFKVKGTPGHENGTFTVALEKVHAGWRILGWAWGRLK